MILDDLISRDAWRMLQIRHTLRATADGAGIGMDDILAVLRMGPYTRVALADGGFTVVLDGAKIPRGDARQRARQIALSMAATDTAALWHILDAILAQNLIASAPVADDQLEAIRARYSLLATDGRELAIREAAATVLQLAADLTTERGAAAELAKALHTIYETAVIALAIPPEVG